MQIVKKINNKLRLFEEVILSMSMLLIAVILVGNVVVRTLFNFSFAWAEEISSLLSIFITFIGVSYVARVGRHISMSALYDAMSFKGKKIFMLISAAVTMLLLLYLMYYSITLVQAMRVSGRVTSALLWPMWIPYMMLPVGFGLGAIQYMLILLMNVFDKEVVHTCVEPLPNDYDEGTELEASTGAPAGTGDEGGESR